MYYGLNSIGVVFVTRIDWVLVFWKVCTPSGWTLLCLYLSFATGEVGFAVSLKVSLLITANL